MSARVRDAYTGTPIVAGVDGSRQSRAVASVAARLARMLGHKLILAHAVADPSTFRFPDARERGRRRARAVEIGFALLEGVAATLPDAVGQTAVVLGSPNEALAAFCRQEQAELLVVGSHGRGRLAAALLGSHATADSCPVIVVSPDAADRFLAPAQTAAAVVCGIDGSVAAMRAVRVGANVASRLGLEFVPVYFDQRHSWDGTPAADTLLLHVEAGDPVAGLRRRAVRDEARLIVVGSRGRGALSGALLGSVSRALAASAPAPVLVVPPKARLGELAAAAAGSAPKPAL